MKILRSEKDYNNALVRIEELIDLDPEKGSALFDEIEVLSLLISKYEDEYYPIEMPDPVEAIKFRMEQMGLKNIDSIPFLGSKSKVSEILNRKKKLSLSMIRNLHQGLGIPAEVLISEKGKKLPSQINGIDWCKFPISEMLKKNWLEFKGSIYKANENAEELIREFLFSANLSLSSPVFFRKGIRSKVTMDDYSLFAWQAKVFIEEQNLKALRKYSSSEIDADFFKYLRMLSIFEKGPSLAQEFLLKYGIKLVIVPHLKKTYIDGATFFNNGKPIIALTLRYDRLDYFWFTLFHELAHLILHLNEDTPYFFDDLKAVNNLDQIEIDADNFAESKLIDSDSWKTFYSKILRREDVIEFSNQYCVSPAIISGRIQKKRNDYSIFRDLLGQGKVKDCFNLE